MSENSLGSYVIVYHISETQPCCKITDITTESLKLVSHNVILVETYVTAASGSQVEGGGGQGMPLYTTFAP